MVQIRQHLVSAAVSIKVTGGRKNTRRKVCIHETDNTKKGRGQTTMLDCKLLKQVGIDLWMAKKLEAVQSFTHDWQYWAAGSTQGNNEAIQVEMYVNSDGDYVRTIQNTAALIA